MDAKKILMVDDDDLVLLALRELLTPAGYQVSTSLSGVDALQQLGDTQFDIIIIDIVMPEMDGFELCRLIRSEPGYAETPIIMLTAKSSDEDRKNGLEAGANLFLPKPISPERLLNIIAGAL